MIEAIIGLLFSKAGGLVAAAVAVIAALVGSYVKGNRSGAQKERDKQMRARLESIKKAQGVDANIDAMTDEEVAEELAKWSS